MSDETARGEVGDESDTGIVAGDTARVEAAALAWSTDTTPDFATPVDRRPLPRSLILLLAGVAVAAIALAAFVLGGHANRSTPTLTTPATIAPPPAPAAPRPTAPAAAPSAEASTPTASPTPPPARSDIDASYLAYLHREGVPYRSGDDDAIASAHEICGALDTRPLVDETNSVRRALGWTRDDAAKLVGAAVAYYCPQHVP